MRKIKFRGKNYDGIWMYGYLMPSPKPQIHLDNKFSISVCPQSLSYVDRMHYEVNPNTIGQFTGLRDKNGKEIYEGDIVAYEYSTYAGRGSSAQQMREVNYIEFRQSECKFIVVCKNRHHDLHEPYNIHIEVIGNIHDNPELLKGGNDE